MRTQTLIARLVRVAAAATIATVGLAVSQLAVATPFASASDQVGWIRLAHLSPNTPAVDVYLYSFGNSNAQLVLHHVSYGTVSPFEQVQAGDYTVAMRGAGAPASAKPVLSTVVDVQPGHAYTVAGMGPASGLRLLVIPERLTPPPGKALVRVIQASMQQDVVSVMVGGKTLSPHLHFASGTAFVAVDPGTLSVRAAGSSETAAASVDLAAGSVHTLVVLDEPGKLAIDNLLDAAGSKIDPSGGPQTGFGGTAAHPGAALLPWGTAGLAGLAAAAAGLALVSRRRRPALHAR